MVISSKNYCRLSMILVPVLRIISSVSPVCIRLRGVEVVEIRRGFRTEDGAFSTPGAAGLGVRGNSSRVRRGPPLAKGARGAGGGRSINWLGARKAQGWEVSNIRLYQVTACVYVV